jgi:nitrogenase-associated protein
MAKLTFWEKPGCGGNAQQKHLLAAAGHQLVVRNLLAEPWTRERLLDFLGALPVAEWFNLSAPQVKSGEIDPATLTRDEALAALLAEPLLIRRPLMEREWDGEWDELPPRMVGFDTARVAAWIGLEPSAPSLGEGCAAALGAGCDAQRHDAGAPG